ncbi:thioredoxin-like protein CITRX, chloroplastic isoform X2 [Coffea eugenioides]|uniref:thioredoxin-like protein CITRX, chloroplastic isoform X2 n=1 Tax=Coffea eugenioides TaxID=49369 RepID=UPI000F60D499|nr:thioredoxin-like protein CITRX, chloroplastic isoform X2 [Coffea eugenioides]
MHSALSSSSSFHAPPRLGPSGMNVLQTHYSSSFFFNPIPNRNPISTANGPSLLSTQQPSRKLLCIPPAGKYVREDYLVLAVEYENNVLIVKVDTDNEYEFARDMQVRGLPTLYFISPDPRKDAIRTEGLIPIQMMRDIIENEI